MLASSRGNSLRSSVPIAVVLAVALTLLVTSPATAANAGTLKASVSSGLAGAALTLSGSVPPKAKRAVELQRQSGKKWLKVKSSKTDKNGKFKFKIKIAATTTTYRVYAKKAKLKVVGKAKNYPSANTKSVKVTTKAPAVSAVNWYASYGSFPTTTISGSGDSFVPVPAGARAGLVTASYVGSSNFAVESLDSGLNLKELLVNEVGSYSGTAFFGGYSWYESPSMLQVTASGPWTITFTSVENAPVLPTSGSGSGVFRYDGGTDIAAISFVGSHNFAVQQLHVDSLFGGNTTDLLVNTIGNYSGSQALKAGPSMVVIEAVGGAWTIVR